MLVLPTLLVALGMLVSGCAPVGGGGAPTETEPPTYYTGGLGGGPGSTGQPNQNQYAPPAPTRGNAPPPSAGQPAPAPTRGNAPPPSAGQPAPAPTRGNAPPPTAAQPAPRPTTAGQPAGAFAAVDIENFAYGPATLNARVRQKVVWSNQDTAPHTVTADNLTWGKDIPPGSTYVRAFDKPGTFAYHCAIHPNMRGVLVVS